MEAGGENCGLRKIVNLLQVSWVTLVEVGRHAAVRFWQLLASSRFGCGHLWKQPGNTPTELRSKVRRWSYKRYWQSNTVQIFLITLVTRFNEWNSQPQSTLSYGSGLRCKSTAGWFQNHVHNSHYKEQQPVNVNTICQFSDWDLKRSLRQ